MNETFWGRANRLIKEKGFTQDSFSTKCGLNIRRINNLSGNGNLPKATELIVMAKELNVSIDYLLIGKDSLTEQERNILKEFNKLNEDGKKAAIGAVGGLIPAFPLQSARDGGSTETGA